ncbi:MAG: DUF2314 domain-containing protein [Propionibacterium sp.]|nr:DUF2314 domain-containing protein [Propionibacterium sp.]
MSHTGDADSFGFSLDNAEELRRDHPDSFDIPSHRERTSLQRGDLVKLVFRIVPTPTEGAGAERMWVIISETDGDHYVGHLDNDPFRITTIQAGDPVTFGPEHVIAILGDE